MVLKKEVARKVIEEITESKISDLVRLIKGKNVITFGLEEWPKVKYCERVTCHLSAVSFKL